MASTAEVAEQLVSLCRAGKFSQAVATLYADDIVSIEPVAMPGMPARTEGFEAVQKKNQDWEATNEVHGFRVDGPFVGDSHFAVRYWLDVTNKTMGQRFEMEEMALYTVRDGKVAQEEFYYNMGGGPEA